MMQQPNDLIDFASAQLMAEKLADMVEAKLACAIAQTGSALLAVSGGSTPQELYRQLSERALPWDKVTAVIVDERWIGPEKQGSNEKFICQNLQINRAQDLTVKGLWRDTPDPEAAQDMVEADIGKIFRPFDAVILGMGTDGHTASWFPHAQGLDKALYGPQLVTAIKAKETSVTGEYLQRMTLTLAALRGAHFTALLMIGAEKRASYLQARQNGPVEDMPIRALLAEARSLWACWAP
jgi:6-phosphogluconolactonase